MTLTAGPPALTRVDVPATGPQLTSPKLTRSLQRASMSRVHDGLLGGRDNYPADRTAMAHLTRAYPSYRDALLAGRRFVRAAVERMARAGIDQFLDLGSSMLTRPCVHDLVRSVHPRARLLCVTDDRTAYAHRVIATADQPGVSAVLHDVRDTAGLLDHAACGRALDVTRPTGVLCTEVLHLRPDEDVRDLVDGLRRGLPHGSRLAVTVMGVGDEPTVAHHPAGSREIHAYLGRPLVLRTRRQVAQLLGGLPSLPPGIVELRGGPPGGGAAGSGRLSTVGCLARIDDALPPSPVRAPGNPHVTMRPSPR